MVKRKVIWSKNGSLQLKEALTYLREKSPKSAVKVKKEILLTARELSLHPEIFSLDRYTKDNDGSIRAFEKYSYRVSYQVEETQILILRIRHTSREPLEY
jgi:plasmid stabilization system protein ParE